MFRQLFLFRRGGRTWSSLSSLPFSSYAALTSPSRFASTAVGGHSGVGPSPSPSPSPSSFSSSPLPSYRVAHRPFGYYLIPSLHHIPPVEAFDAAQSCHSITACRGSGPGGQGANSSSSKVEVRVELGMLELYLDELIESGVLEVRGEIPQPMQQPSSVGYGGGECDDCVDVDESSCNGGPSPSSSSSSVHIGATDDAQTVDPEAYLLFYTAHGSGSSRASSSSSSSCPSSTAAAPAVPITTIGQRIVEKMRARLGVLYTKGGCGGIGASTATATPTSSGGSHSGHGGDGGGGAHTHSHRSSASECSSTAFTPMDGPAAALAHDGAFLLLTCNEHRSNHQNVSACMGKLRELIFLSSFVLPTEQHRNKSFRASHHSVNKAKARRQMGSNMRRAQQAARKGQW